MGYKVIKKKSKILHTGIRNMGAQCTDFNFSCGNTSFYKTDKYKYLVLVFNKFLDMSVTVRDVSQSANGALHLIINKVESIGGVPFHFYTKVYDSLVNSVINYVSCIWGAIYYSCALCIVQYITSLQGSYWALDLSHPMLLCGLIPDGTFHAESGG